MSTMLQRLQEDEEIARERHMRLELHRLSLQRQPGTTTDRLEAVQAEIDAAAAQWRVVQERLDESEKQAFLLAE